MERTRTVQQNSTTEWDRRSAPDQVATIDTPAAEGRGPGRVPARPEDAGDHARLVDSIRGRRILDVAYEPAPTPGYLRNLRFEFDDGSSFTVVGEGFSIAEIVAAAESGTEPPGTAPSDHRATATGAY